MHMTEAEQLNSSKQCLKSLMMMSPMKNSESNGTSRYHKAAGHPNNYNLARVIREAGQPRWKVEAALQLPCDDCKALKMGGTSAERFRQLL